MQQEHKYLKDCRKVEGMETVFIFQEYGGWAQLKFQGEVKPQRYLAAAGRALTEVQIC